MQLTIILTDGAVYEDSLCYSNLIWEDTPINVHALQFNTDTSLGWIEFNDGTPNQDITSIPIWGQNAETAWQVAYNEAHQPPIPHIPTAEENKATASSLLTATDWTVIADVGNPQLSSPYLANQADFIAYRNAVRQYAVYPVAGNINWAIIPIEVWQTV